MRDVRDLAGEVLYECVLCDYLASHVFGKAAGDYDDVISNVSHQLDAQVNHPTQRRLHTDTDREISVHRNRQTADKNHCKHIYNRHTDRHKNKPMHALTDHCMNRQAGRQTDRLICSK